MNVLVVEDEIIIAAELSLLLNEMGYFVCGMAINYTSGVKLLEEKKPDLAIIDINLGGSKTGIDLGHFINENYNIPFIFLTSNVDQSTIESALECRPHSYLLKPFNKIEIFTSISLALQHKSSGKKLETSSNEENLIINNAIFIKNKELFVKVNLNEIIYFKSDKNYVEVTTASKTFLIRSTLANLLNELPTNTFVKVHKSYLVNLSKISAINHELVFADGKEIPMHENYRKELIQNLKTFS